MGPRIFFADDEAPIRELLSVFFRKKGFEVTTATNVGEAKAALEKESFNMAILDLDLAGENSLELIGFAKQKYPAMPVIVFTGMGDDRQLMQQVREKGADAFLRKTHSLDEVLVEVNRLLRKAASANPK